MPGVALLVFREVLEAALIISMVCAATRGVANRGLFVSGGVARGVIGALLVAWGAGAPTRQGGGATRACGRRRGQGGIQLADLVADRGGVGGAARRLRNRAVPVRHGDRRYRCGRPDGGYRTGHRRRRPAWFRSVFRSAPDPDEVLLSSDQLDAGVAGG